MQSLLGVIVMAENSKICAILSYLLVGIIWYFVDENMKKDKFVKYHVKQGLVLLIVWVIGDIVFSIIPVIGWILFPIFSLAMIVLMVLGIINAANGQEKELPIIGQFASKFTF